MQAYLAPVFQLLFGLGLMLFLFAVMRWRTPLYARGGHLLLVGMFLIPLALFFLSRGVGSRGDQSATVIMIGGGVLFAAILVQLFAIQKFARTALSGAATQGRN